MPPIHNCFLYDNLRHGQTVSRSVAVRVVVSLQPLTFKPIECPAGSRSRFAANPQLAVAGLPNRLDELVCHRRARSGWDHHLAYQETLVKMTPGCALHVG